MVTHQNKFSVQPVLNIFLIVGTQQELLISREIFTLVQITQRK